MKLSGTILKMDVKLASPVEYKLPVGDKLLPMNDLIGEYIILKHTGVIYCISCGRKISRSFSQGFCYPCFINAPETSECIFRPALCEAHEGISRDMDWAENHCLQDHYVYLAISSGDKVGVTRSSQIPTRWIDQGAWKAIRLAKTPNRYTAGLIEVALKEHISDKTHWQRMLKNQLASDVDLLSRKQEMVAHLAPELQVYEDEDSDIVEITYPVNEYPTKVKSIGFDKSPEIAGRLWGIKGQYLIFDDGRVTNIRKHNGYVIDLDLPDNVIDVKNKK